jgi:hypothetical protein
MADEPWYLIADMPATSDTRERSQLIWRGDRALNETDPGTPARIVDILEFLARSAVPARSVASSPAHQTPAKTDPWRQSAPAVAGRWPLPALTARTVAVLAASLRFWYPINHVGDVRARHARLGNSTSHRPHLVGRRPAPAVR